jgi:hypothetical protein
MLRSTILGCLIITFFTGQFLCCDLIHPLFPSFVDRGINSTSPHCLMLSGDRSYAVVTAGLIVLSMSLRCCMTVNSRRCLTPWFQSQPSPAVDDRRIRGSTKNVAYTSVQFDDSSVSPVPVELRKLPRHE